MKTPTPRSSSIFVGALLSLLVSCSSMRVQTASDPEANLSQYKTYGWAPTPPATPDRPQQSILDQTVKSSIEKGLAAKGLVPAKGAQADMLINYFGVSRSAITYGSTSHDYWGHWGHYDHATVTREGALTLQFIDAATKRIVWQGTAADTISEAGASEKQIATAVKKLIERFPVA